jgi:hypothetical protein
MEVPGAFARHSPGMLNTLTNAIQTLTNTTQGLWIIAALAVGVVALICWFVVARTRTKIVQRVVRTEVHARADQANRDRLAGRR